MLSFWEKRSFINYDYIVVGGGIVGLSTAASIKEKRPQAKVLILERGIFPTGASTKNAGFACFGSLTELLADLKVMGADETLKIVEERWRGLLALRKRLGDDKIDFLNYGGYELLRTSEVDCLNEIDKVNELLKPIFQKNVFEEKHGLIDKFGFDKKSVKSLIFNQFEGQIDTGKMMKSLADYVKERGVEILTGAEVVDIIEENSQVIVQVENGGHQHINFACKKMAVCTNAFTQKLFPELGMKPGRGVVLVTKPIEDLKFQGVFHYDEGYFYFRNFEDRVIFGGGRNLDFETETTTEFEVNEKIKGALEQQLKEIVLPNQKVEIEDWWAGIMAFGDDKRPILEAYSDKIILGVRLGGMGVAIGSRLGEAISEMILAK